MTDGGVAVGEVLGRVEWRLRQHDRVRRQREDLEAGAVECDQVPVDEGVAGEQVVVEAELQGGADPIVGVWLTPVRSPASTRKR